MSFSLAKVRSVYNLVKRVRSGNICFTMIGGEGGRVILILCALIIMMLFLKLTCVS